jgi:hypothetical protein
MFTFKNWKKLQSTICYVSARDNWSTLDFANAFASQGVNSRGELVPSHGASRRRLGDYINISVIIGSAMLWLPAHRYMWRRRGIRAIYTSENKPQPIGSPKRRVECTKCFQMSIYIKLATFLCHLSRAASTQLKSSVDIYRLATISQLTNIRLRQNAKYFAHVNKTW